MRHQGKITDWKDDKGFGFVTPNGGGPRVFVHVNSFSNRRRRPVGNELVTFDLTTDKRGRPRGANVGFVGELPSVHPTTAPGPGNGALIFAGVFLALVAGAVAMERLPLAVFLTYFIASCVTFVVYVFDKAASLKGEWRTPEGTLHFLSLMCGWPGALLAQRVLRHKTQKRSFQLMYWATVVLNTGAVGWALWPAGMRAAKSFLGVA